MWAAEQTLSNKVVVIFSVYILIVSSLLWHSLSDLGVSDLLADSCRLNLLHRTHDAILFAPMGLNQGVHPVRVEHDVVGRDQQHPAHGTLNPHRE